MLRSSSKAKIKKPQSETCWKPNEGDFSYAYQIACTEIAYMSNESGATAIEYALIAAGVGLAIIAGVVAFGDALQGLFDTLAGALDGEA